MPRVYEVAKELGVSSKDVLARLEDIGEGVPSHSSGIDDATAAKIKEHFNGAASSDEGAASQETRARFEVPRRTTAPGAWAPRPVRTGATEEDEAAGAATPGEPAASASATEAPAPAEAEAPETGAAETAAVETTADGPVTPAEAVAEVEAAPVRPRWRAGLVQQLKELPMLILFAFVIAVVVKTFLVQAFFIPSGSMKPTLQVGDRVLVEKISYFIGDPDPGDVVVFERSVFGKPPDVPWYEDIRTFLRDLLGLPTGGAEDYIKRIVATGGDTIRYAGQPRRLIVNGERVREPDISRSGGAGSTLTGADCERLEMGRAGDACRVPAGEVFVMGDNRGHSEDSRILGPIDESRIVGRAFTIIWPLDRLGGL